ncbi:hypothetical protein [Streptomyces platensis]|uniref:hypothetical protein n=1 Tax=Streptomyces platensis TaxID=58346 RepID=UPI002E252EAB
MGPAGHVGPRSPATPPRRRDGGGSRRIAHSVGPLPAHPFFLATLFQPELNGGGTRAHPLITGLASAAVDHVGAR